MTHVMSWLRTAIQTRLRSLGLGILDLRKDQSPRIFLPGHLRATFEALGINCVIDVGANQGQFAKLIRHFGYSGRIVSIEPEEESYVTLRNVSQRDSLWRTLNIALGDKDEERVLNVFQSSNLSSFLSPTTAMRSNIRDSQIVRTQRTTVKRLDSIFDSLIEGIVDPRVFLKLDTQGYDVEVVAGGKDAIRHVAGLQSELSVIPLYQGMVGYLEALRVYHDLGFEPSGIFPVAWDQQKHVIEFDAVLTRYVPSESGLH